MKLKLSTLLWITFLISGAASAIGIPKLRERRRRHAESAAIGSLKAIANAQTLYREADKDGNGRLEYAPDLASLARYGLVSPELADGEDQGYRFAVRRHASQPNLDQFVWSASAEPLEPGESGEVYFGANMAGLIFFSRELPVSFNEDGSSGAGYMCNCGEEERR